MRAWRAAGSVMSGTPEVTAATTRDVARLGASHCTEHSQAPGLAACYLRRADGWARQPGQPHSNHQHDLQW